MIKVVLVLLSTLWLGVVAASWSEAAEGDGSSSGDEAYNFSWLDPEKKIYVLQNRRYTKANRLLLSASVGLADTSAYRTSYSIDPRLAYYFSEQFGIEVFYQMISNKENNTAKSLNSTNVAPNVLQVKNQIGALLHWAPWYAKINVFNWILYFDWYFSGGIGTVGTEAFPGRVGNTTNTGTAGQKSYTGYYLGTGHQYHLNENWIVRLDFTNVWFQAPKNAISDENTFYNSSTFEMGIGIRL